MTLSITHTKVAVTPDDPAYEVGSTEWNQTHTISGAADTITVANEATDTTCFPLFVTAATGDLAPKTNTGLTINSNTRALATTGTMTAAGLISSAYVSIAATDNLSWNGRSLISSPSDGVLRLSNNALTDFTRLQFGGTTSSFPAIKRTTTALNFRVADDSADCGITASTGTFSGAVNTTIATTTVSSPGTIEAVAINGLDTVTWTPATNPGATGVFVTNRMRKTVVDVGTASITGAGVSHPIAGYDYLLMQGNTNTLDYAFVSEQKFKKTGTGLLNNLSFVKPAIDSIAGSVTNLTLFDGTMDLTGVTFTNAYLMRTTNTNLPIQTAGLIQTSGGDQQVLPRDRPGVVSGRYYPNEGVTALFASTTHSRNVAWAVPFICPERTTWTKIGFTNGIGIASAVGRLGISKDSGGVPTTLILDAGTVTAGVADLGAREITISQSLDAGIYWLMLAIQGGAADNSITYASVNTWSINGMPSNTAQDGNYIIACAGAFPASFGAGAFAGAGFTPFLWMRK